MNKDIIKIIDEMIEEYEEKQQDARKSGDNPIITIRLDGIHNFRIDTLEKLLRRIKE